MWRPFDVTTTDSAAAAPEVVNIQDDDEQFPVQISEDSEVATSTSRTHLPVEAKQIVLNVFNYHKAVEGESGAISKTAKMTLVPESTVRKIVSQGIEPRKVRKR